MSDSKGMNSPLVVASTVASNIKPILYVGGGIAALVIGYKVYKKFFPGGLSTDQTKPPATITDSQALTIAERCYQAMYAVGTDEDALMAALSGLSYNDYVKVSKAFGRRSYFYPTGEAPVFDWMGAKLSLEEWIIQELNVSEINQLKEQLPEIF